MKPKLCYGAIAAATALLTPMAAIFAQIGNLRITEVDVQNDKAEVTNTGPDFNDVASRPFCHRFVYTSVIPGMTNWSAGQVNTYTISGLDSNDSDLWLYTTSSFSVGANIVHGLKFGPAANVGRTALAATVGLWPSGSAYCPKPPNGMTLSWDGFGFSPRDWYIDASPSLGSADPATTPSVVSALVSPFGEDTFENVPLGDTVDALIDYVVVNSSTTPGIFTVRCVNDVLSDNANPRPGSDSVRWLRIRDQDAGNVQNRFYTVPITTGGEFDYSWTFYINIEETPPGGGGSTKPRIVVQHLDGTFQNAWGIEFDSNGANVVVTGIGGTTDAATLYSLGGATGLGQWVKIVFSVDFVQGLFSISANDDTPVSLPISLSPTADKGQFRLCYRGEGTGNINTMLLDDISVFVNSVVVFKGDMDHDNDVDFDDIPGFVDVLIGVDEDAEQIDRADIDDLGTADGEDIDDFISLIL